MLMSAPVSWGSKKQSSVSLSTSEAEYIALSLAIQEGKWIHRLLCEILAAANETGPPEPVQSEPTPITPPRITPPRITPLSITPPVGTRL
ncbi:hypothetical protein PC114_g28162 [Phytophthora cactorum]|nr:hypothetical protein PC114_g28162 [Phytophthora cactorum]